MKYSEQYSDEISAFVRSILKKRALELCESQIDELIGENRYENSEVYVHVKTLLAEQLERIMVPGGKS